MKFFITTSIAYANALPHIGFALELTQADVLARYRRSRGGEVFFQTGVDEHGTKIARAAAKAGKKPEIFTAEIAEESKALRGALNLSWDVFVRTSDRERHFKAAQKLWRRLEKAGDIYKKEYEGFYCVGCEAFLTPKDLTGGRCPVHLSEPERLKEENYFFRLSKYAGEIESKIKNREFGIFPESRRNETLSFIKSGLEDISFSRPTGKLSWGIPVPSDKSQTMYVWADALANYLDYEERWPADIHLVGKDILRFHTIVWPAMLLSAGLPLPKTIFVHGFITVGGEKMSKSLGNVVDPFDLTNRYGSDAVRYFLLREIPSSEDGDFTEEKFKARYNGDLANGLGNFAARVLTLGSKLGEFEDEAPDEEVGERIKKTVSVVDRKMSEFKFNEALTAVWELIGYGDKYANENKPWATGDKRTVFNLLVLLKETAEFLTPFLPEAAEKIKARFNRRDGVFSVTTGEPLFQRL